MPRAPKRLGTRKRKSRFSGGRKLRRKLKQQRKTTKVAKKLSSAVQYGPRIAPRSIIAKLRWYNVYGGPLSGPTVPFVPPYDNNGFIIPGNTSYTRTWNLSSIFQPDTQNDGTGAGAFTVYNYKEYQPHYQKWIVRAAKVKGWIQSISHNGSINSSSVPTTVYLWADNNSAASVASVDTNREAFIQQGRKIIVLDNNAYSSRKKWFKRYFRHQKILKRRLDEDEDFGTMTTLTGASAGTNPPSNATVYLHMLIINNTEEDNHLSWSLDITFFTKLWDSPVDDPDQEDPDG